MRVGVTVGEAQGALLAAVAVQPTLRLPLDQAAGHVLAHDIVTPWPLPPWTAASMDGWAVRAADLHQVPIRLPIAGESDAGGAALPSLPPGSAWRVATGGRVPSGADSVVRVEDSQRDGDAVVTITDRRDAGRNVRPAGGDLASGALALSAGTVIGAGQVALLAAVGEAAPLVYRRPRVAILSSGDEVSSLDQADRIASGERIADVNTPMLAALVRAAGGVVVPLKLVGDDAAAIAAAVQRAGDAELVITAGGISVGQRDFVPAAMAALGATVLVRRVRLRPGGPTTLAVLPDGRSWLALPGNPVSAFVTFHLFAKVAIAKMMGIAEPVSAPGLARLKEPVTRDPVLDQYLRVTLEPAGDGGPPWAALTGPQGSWLTSSVARAEGLVVVTAGDGGVGAGEVVATLSLG